MSDLRASLSRSANRRARVPAPRKRPVWAIAAGLVLAVLVIAAIDGGERALHPISEEIALPAGARGSISQ